MTLHATDRLESLPLERMQAFGKAPRVLQYRYHSHDRRTRRQGEIAGLEDVQVLVAETVVGRVAPDGIRDLAPAGHARP